MDKLHSGFREKTCLQQLCLPSWTNTRFCANSQPLENTVNLTRKLTCMETKKLSEIRS